MVKPRIGGGQAMAGQLLRLLANFVVLGWDAGNTGGLNYFSESAFLIFFSNSLIFFSRSLSRRSGENSVSAKILLKRGESKIVARTATIDPNIATALIWPCSSEISDSNFSYLLNTSFDSAWIFLRLFFAVDVSFLTSSKAVFAFPLTSLRAVSAFPLTSSRAVSASVLTCVRVLLVSFGAYVG